MMNRGVDIERGGLRQILLIWLRHIRHRRQRVAGNVASRALHGVREQLVGGAPRLADGGCPLVAEAIPDRPEQRGLNRLVVRIAHAVSDMAPPKKFAGSSRPRTRLASVTVGSVPPRP